MRSVPVLALACLLLSAPLAQAADITVFAAASLRGALDAAAADWQVQSGHQVTLSYAATPALARQIEAGAPADLLIAASADWMDRLEAAGLILAESRRDLFGSRLVVIAPGVDAGGEVPELTTDFDFAAALGTDGHLAMAMVDSVPAGIYGRQALSALGLWADLAPRVAQSENVRAALALVATGEAPLGIVYATDAQAEPRVRVLARIPAGLHEPITYPGALVADSAAPDAARAFLDYLSGAEAGQIFAAQGFVLPGTPP